LKRVDENESKPEGDEANRGRYDGILIRLGPPSSPPAQYRLKTRITTTTTAMMRKTGAIKDNLHIINKNEPIFQSYYISNKITHVPGFTLNVSPLA